MGERIAMGVGANKGRHEVLRDAGFGNFEHYQQSPLWKTVELRAYQRLGKRCWICRGGAREIFFIKLTAENLAGTNFEHMVPLCGECSMTSDYSGDANGRRLSLEEKVGRLEEMRRAFNPKKRKLKPGQRWQQHRKGPRMYPKQSK